MLRCLTFCTDNKTAISKYFCAVVVDQLNPHVVIEGHRVGAVECSPYCSRGFVVYGNNVIAPGF